MPELLVSTLLLTAIFVGVMLTFVKSTQLSDLSRYSAVAVLASKSKLAEIESSAYAQVPAYNNVTFNSNDITGIGVSYVDSSNPDLLQITVVFCWRQRDGRVIGEDRDLDGVLDGGEDLNGNNRLDSVVEFTTLRYNS